MPSRLIDSRGAARPTETNKPPNANTPSKARIDREFTETPPQEVPRRKPGPPNCATIVILRRSSDLDQTIVGCRCPGSGRPTGTVCPVRASSGELSGKTGRTDPRSRCVVFRSRSCTRLAAPAHFVSGAGMSKCRASLPLTSRAKPFGLRLRTETQPAGKDERDAIGSDFSGSGTVSHVTWLPISLCRQTAA